MNEKTITVIAFFTSLLVFGQIRFFLKLRRIRKNSRNLSGDFYWAGAIDLCFAVGDCGKCCGSIAEGAAQEGRRREQPTEQKALSKEFQRWQPKEETIEGDYLSIEEEIKKVQDMVKGSPKTSLGWVVNTTKLPIKRVVVIIGNDPNLMIVKDQIINLSMLTEAELEERGMKERIQKMKVREQKPIKRITATEEERNKLIEIVSLNPKTGLIFASNVSKLTKEEIVLIIEIEPDFEIRDEYIINKKKVLLEKEKKKTAENICPNCEKPFDPGSEFCPNCGLEL